MNKANSEFDANHRPADATITFEVDAEGNYVMRAEGTKENGERVVERPTTFVIDGLEHPVPDFPGLRVISTRVDPDTVRSEVRREDGSLAGGGTYALSVDGTTLTITNFGFDSQLREFKQKTVWDRA